MRKWKKLTAIALMTSIVCSMAACGDNNEDDFRGIKVDDEVYTFSASEGIDDYENINNGVVCSSGMNYEYYEKGASESVVVDVNNYYTYIISSAGQACVINDMTIKGMLFIFTDNYETEDGITKNSSVKEIEKAGYMKYRNGNNSYVQLATAEENLDWKEIEEDYKEAQKTGDFSHLSYYESFKTVLPDKMKININDFEAMLECVADGDVEGKNLIMFYLGYAMLTDKLVSGEIRYFYYKEVSAGNKNILSVEIISDVDNVLTWMDNWK